MTKQEFWTAFEKHMPGLEALIEGKSNSYEAYNAVTADLKKFNDLLIPEITMEKEGLHVLIISCDGVRSGIPALKELTDGVESYLHWKNPREWVQNDEEGYPQPQLSRRCHAASGSCYR